MGQREKGGCGNERREKRKKREVTVGEVMKGKSGGRCGLEEERSGEEEEEGLEESRGRTWT